jgi:hypothetical protein
MAIAPTCISLPPGSRSCGRLRTASVPAHAHRPRSLFLCAERSRSAAGREHRERSVRWSAWFRAGPRQHETKPTSGSPSVAADPVATAMPSPRHSMT